MTFPLQELEKLLTPGTTTVGVVVAIDGTKARVATPRGAVTASAAERLATGDRVLIRAGLAYKAPIAQRVFPV